MAQVVSRQMENLVPLPAVPQSKREALAHVGLQTVLELEGLRDRGIINVRLGVRPPASAQQIQQWEDEHYPYKLPDDLKAFLAFSNGVEAAWDILLRPGATPICGAGRLRINDVAHLQRLPLDADDQAALGGDPAPPLGFCAVDGSDQSKSGTSQAAEDARIVAAAFLLDACPFVGNVVLLYRSGGAAVRANGTTAASTAADPHATPEVWLQEPGGMWCAIADDITCYLRLAAAHAYVHGWHHAYAPAGLSPPTERLLALVAPARLQFDQEMLHDAEGALD